MKKNKKYLNIKSIILIFVTVFSFFLINNSFKVDALSCSFLQKEVKITTSLSDPNGGEIEAPESVCAGYFSGASVTINLKTLTDGYTFLGWYDKNNNLQGDGARSFTVNVSTSGTYNYIAKVVKSYKVTYIGIGEDNVRVEYGSYSYEEGSEINLNEFFERTSGNEITSYLVDGNEIQSNIYTVESKNVIIEVYLENSYKITLVGDSGFTPKFDAKLYVVGDVIDITSCFTLSNKYKFVKYQINDADTNSTNYTVSNHATVIKAVSTAKDINFYGSDFSTEIYETLEEALASGEKKIYLASDYTITGDITINSDITLILPYQENSTKETENGTKENADVRLSWANPNYLYLTMTVAKGAKLTIKGGLTVGAIQHYPHQRPSQGHTSGAYSQIINNGEMQVDGVLKVYGLIKGDGVISLNSGSKTYEPLMINDYAGGKNTQKLYNSSGGHLPFSQITTANIQCKHIINYGAEMYGMGSIYALDMINTQTGTMVAPCNSTCSNDSIIKMQIGSRLEVTYNPNKKIDTVLFEKDIHLGDFGVNTIKVYGEIIAGEFSMNASIYGKVSSSGKYFGISYTYNIIVEDGGVLTIPEKNKYKVMPGMVLEIKKGATLNINGGLLVYDSLIQTDMSEKIYPPADILEQYGFSKTGVFIVDGVLNINDGSEFAGIIQTRNSDGSNSAIINTKNFNEGDSVKLSITDGGNGEYSDNTSIFTLSPRVYGLGGYVELERNSTYKAYSKDSFNLEKFKVDSASNCESGYCNSLEIMLNVTMQGRILKWEDSKYVGNVTHYINSKTGGVTVNIGGVEYVTDINGNLVATYKFNEGDVFYYYTVDKENENTRHSVSVGLYEGYVLLDEIVEKIEFVKDEYVKKGNSTFGLEAKGYYYGDDNAIQIKVKDPTLVSGYIIYPNNAMPEVTYEDEDGIYIINNQVKLVAIPAEYEEYQNNVDNLNNSDNLVEDAKKLYSEYVSYRDNCLNNEDKNFVISYLKHDYASRIITEESIVVGEITYGDESKTINAKTLDGNNTRSITVVATRYVVAKEDNLLVGYFKFEDIYEGRTIIYDNIISNSIKQKEISIMINDVKTALYGQEEVKLTMQFVGENSFLVNGDKEDVIRLYRSDATNLDVGDYPIYAESIHKGYKLIVTNEAVYTINPLVVKVTVDDHKDILVTNKANDIEFSYSSELNLNIIFEIRNGDIPVATVENKKVMILDNTLYDIGEFSVYPTVKSQNYTIVSVPGNVKLVEPKDYYTVTIDFTKEGEKIEETVYYDGKIIDVEVQIKVNNDPDEVVNYQKLVNGSLTAIIRDAREYEVIISIGEYSLTKNIVINKKVVTAVADKLEFEYNGKAQQPTFTLNGIVSSDDIVAKTEATNNVNAYDGYEIEVYLYGDSANNYTLASNNIFKYNILKKEVELKVDKHTNVMESNKEYISDFVFTSNVNKNIFNKVDFIICKVNGENIEQIAIVDNGNVIVLENKVYGVGNYKVYAKVDENNFIITNSIPGDLEIVEDNSYYTVNISFKKGDEIISSIVEYDQTIVDLDIKVMVTETKEIVENFEYVIKNSEGYNVIKNAGEYIVDVKIGEVLYSSVGNIKISKKILTTMVDADGFVYNGQIQQPIFEITGYFAGDEVNVETSNEKSIDVGDNYFVRATLTGKDSFNYSLEFIEKKYQITQLKVELEVLPHRYLKLSEVGNDIFFETDITNNGELNPLIVYEIYKENNLIAKVINGQVNVESAMKFNVGEYKVFATIQSKNYYIEKSTPINLRVVEDKDYYKVKVEFYKNDTSISQAIYDGEKIMVNVSVVLAETEKPFEDFEYLVNGIRNIDIINTGTYKISVNVDNVKYDDLAQIMVLPRKIDFTYDYNSFVYDGTNQNPKLSLVNYIEGDDVSIKAINNTITVGNYTIKGSLVGEDVANYELEREITLDYTITKAKLEISIDKISSVYGDVEELLTFKYTGAVASNDNIYNFISLKKEEGDLVGFYDVVGTNYNDNYDVTFVGEENAYEIEKRKLTIDIPKIVTTYGEDEKELTARIIVGTLVNGDTLEDIIRLYREEGNIANTYTIYFENKSNNYEVEEITSTYTINPRKIEVFVHNAGNVYGEAYQDIKIDIVSGSLAYQETLDDILSITCPLENRVGVYEIEAISLNNTNYNLTIRYENKNNSIYEITKRPITIAVNDIKVDSDATWEQLDGLIKYEIVSGNIAGNDNLNIEIVIDMQSGITLNEENFDAVFGGGDHTIKVKASNSNYNINLVYGKLTVTKRILSIQGIETNYVYRDGEIIVPFNWRENIVNYNQSANDNTFTYVLTMKDSNGEYNEVESIVNAGEYRLQIVIVYSHAYEFDVGTKSVYDIVVDKKDISEEIELYNIPSEGTVVYNTLGFLPGVELPIKYEYVYYKEVLILNGEVADMALNAGNYIYSVSLDNQNYKGSKTVEFEITKKDISDKIYFNTKNHEVVIITNTDKITAVAEGQDVEFEYDYSKINGTYLIEVDGINVDGVYRINAIIKDKNYSGNKYLQITVIPTVKDKLEELKNLVSEFDNCESEDKKQAIVAKVTYLLNTMTKYDLQQIEDNDEYQEIISEWEIKEESYINELNEQEKRNVLILWISISGFSVMVLTIALIFVIKKYNKKRYL